MFFNDYRFVEYDRLFIGIIRIDRWGYTKVSYSEIRTRPSINKMACFSKINTSLPHGVINSTTAWYINHGEKIWVSPKCRIPRDLIRNSGYKCVRDKEDANYIIVPDGSGDYLCYTGNVLGYDVNTNTLYIYTIERSDNSSRKLTEEESAEEYEKIKKRLQYYDSDILTYSPNKTITVELLPKCEEWKELLTNKYPQKRFMSELILPINYPVEINVETLMIWKHSSDYNLLSKAIIASNWKEYPATMLYFLLSEHRSICNYGGPQMKLILDQIHFDRYNYPEEALEKTTIQPKDWNLLQDYIMAKLGLPETGGYVTEKQLKDMYQYDDIMRTRVAIKPLKISEPMNFTNLKEIIAKS